MKSKETYKDWSQSKSKYCGLRILSIYVRPFRIMHRLMFVCGFSWCEVLQTLRQTPSKTCVMYTRGACMYCENSTWILDKHTACVYYDHNTCLHFAATTNTPTSNFQVSAKNDTLMMVLPPWLWFCWPLSCFWPPTRAEHPKLKPKHNIFKILIKIKE